MYMSAILVRGGTWIGGGRYSVRRFVICCEKRAYDSGSA
jgi:hypothetical protein